MASWSLAIEEKSIAKPSFLFLLVDDIGWADFSYNNGTAITAKIDDWAKADSMIFHDFHSGGTVCSPTRATVLTGRNHFRDCVNFVYGCSDMSTCVPNMDFAPSRTFTVGDAVRAAGDDYDNGVFFAGKWHLGSFYNDSEHYGGKTSSPITHGFDHFNATIGCAPTYTLNCQCKAKWEPNCHFGHYNDSFHFCYGEDSNHCCFNYWWDDPMQPHGVNNLTEPTEPDDAMYLVDAFSRFIDKRKQQELPFLAQISFHNCHIPFIGSVEAVEACARNETCRPPSNGIPYTDRELDYYACLTQLDKAVGEILEILKSKAYFDNTMVWMTSDNGPEHNCPPQGICQHGDSDPARPIEGPGSAGLLRGRKRDIYEGGHRVPGIVSWPAYFQGGVSTWETASTMDFLPTILEVLEVERPFEQQNWAMDGRSILPLLKGEQWKGTKGGEREIGWGYQNPTLSSKSEDWGYRFGKWKYVLGSTSCTMGTFCQSAQLFDLEADLGERHDISEQRPDILFDMQQRLHRWHQSIFRSRRDESHCPDALGILEGVLSTSFNSANTDVEGS